MDNWILQLSTWVGLSEKPYLRRFFLSDDGNFVNVTEYSLPGDKGDNVEKNGKIDGTRMQAIRSFLAENIKESSSERIYDAGWTIRYRSEKGLVEIENDQDLFGKLVELLPEYKS